MRIMAFMKGTRFWNDSEESSRRTNFWVKQIIDFTLDLISDIRIGLDTRSLIKISYLNSLA